MRSVITKYSDETERSTRWPWKLGVEFKCQNGDVNCLANTCCRTPNKKGPTSMAENALMESEASVLATFDFLGNVNTVDDEENLR